MNTRILSFVTIAMLLCGFLAACSSVTGNEADEAASRGKQTYTTVNPGGAAGPIKPVLRNTLTFDFDETAPAVKTLSDYPKVTKWRLKLNATLPKADVLSGSVAKLKSTATVYGYDARGNLIADGTAHVANENKLDTWYCTVQVDNKRLVMAEAGALITNIVADIEAGGDGNPFKRTPCWVLAMKAAGGVAGSVVGGAAVLAACFGTAGTGCAAAILTYIAAEGKFVEWVVDWYCQCVDPEASFCDE